MSAPETVGVGVVLLNYCGATDTLACLDSLLDSAQPFARLAICDNASPDGSMALLRDGLTARADRMALAASVHGLTDLELWAESDRSAVEGHSAPVDAWILLINNQDNRGFAAGNNVGLRWLQSIQAVSHFWLLNNDTEVPTATMGAIRSAIARRPEVDLWGGTVLYHHDPEQVQAWCGGAVNRRTAETHHLGAFTRRTEVPLSDTEVAAIESQVDYALGACMVASRRWLTTAGLLCEDYFLFYEELDWATRGRKLGLRLGYAPQVVVLHKEGASIGTAPGGGSALSVRHLVRSRIVYARLHCSAFIWPTLMYGVVKQSIKFFLQGRFSLVMITATAVFEGLSARVKDAR